jgi:hypothetical protein
MQRMIRLPSWSVALGVAALALPSVTASIVQRPGTVAGETAITVRLRPIGLTLGSYEGTLRYAPGSFAIVSATTPTDGTRGVNARDSARGVIRFGGMTVSRFKTEDVLTLVVRPLRKLETASLAVDVSAAGDLQGKAVPSDHLVPARGITTESGRQ